MTIGVAGMACRFPGAASPQAFWNLLLDARVVPPKPRAHGYPDGEGTPFGVELPPGRFLDGVDEFDPELFGIAPAEAPAIDPQHRLLLEVAWEALEDAGIRPGDLAGSNAGVYVGISYSDYAADAVSRGAFSRHDANGNALCLAANRLSYALDLHGPSLAVDSACSSSLYALHLAHRDLRTGAIDIAIVGGVNLIITPHSTEALQRAGMLAADGLCKTFDRRADGYGRAEGCGVVVLQREGGAARSRLPPYAVLRGSAVNQDGRSNGLCAPNLQAQTALLEAALADAGVEAGQVDLVECHGTGTSLGDAIEISALNSVFSRGRPAGVPLTLGAAKANIGHAEAAAGIVGFIKTALALHHHMIPGVAGLGEINARLDLGGAALRVSAAAHPWLRPDGRRIAGVSSFGFGGTNVHVIVAAAPEQLVQPAASELALFVLSAKTPAALRTLAGHHAVVLRAEPCCEIGALCRAVQTGREPFTERLAVRADDAGDLAAKLAAFAEGCSSADLWIGRAADGVPPVTLFCPGEQGEYEGVLSGLAGFPAFRDALQQTEALLRRAAPGVHGTERKASAPLMAFALNVALGAFWRDVLGGVPANVTGVGVGEIAAGFLARQFNMETAVRRALAYRPGHPGAHQPPPATGRAIRMDARPFEDASGAAVPDRCAAALAELYVGGLPIAWASLYEGVGRRLALPSYRFERRSYWHRPAPAVVLRAASEAPGAQNVAAQLRSAVVELLEANPETLDFDRTLIEHGADSFDLVRLAAALDERLGRRINVEDMIEGSPSLRALAVRIAHTPARPSAAMEQAATISTEVAPVRAAADPPAPAPTADAPADIAAVMQRQLDLVSSVVAQQLEVLRTVRAPASAQPAAMALPRVQPVALPACVPAIGLSFFGMGGAEGGRREYDGIIDLAKRADRDGLAAVWLPERHFHALGGFSPNPVVLHAALARETSRIALRAGSVVLPLHHPVRVAEEWAMLDNLSGGRAGLAAAAGWNADDFILAPENHAESRQRMYESLDAINRLWRGKTYRGRNGRGNEIEIKLFPRPTQRELPVWISILRDPASFVEAGRRGFGVLTNLIAQSVPELTANIAAYREARAAAGHDAAGGRVVLLLHTYLDDDAERGRREAFVPFRRYLDSAAGLFPSFLQGRGRGDEITAIEGDREALIRAAYARYVEDGSLIGSAETAAGTMRRLAAVGVDEVAAFVDFGAPQMALERTLDHLPALARQLADPGTPPVSVSVDQPNRAAAAETLPLTPMQAPLWWTAQTEPERMAAFNFIAVLEASGGIDRAAVAAALAPLLERHGALRASFTEDRTQIIHPRVALPLGEAEVADEAALAAWLKTERRRPFDLSQAPLLRATTLRVGVSACYLVVAASHLISDGGALRVILAELAAGYAAARRGVAAVLPAAPPFAAYVRQATAADAVPAQTLDYWRTKFALPAAALDLPTDRTRPAKRSFRGACRVAAIPRQERDAIEALARSKDATLLMVLAAAFAVLLARMSGENDVTYGIELAGRRGPRMERLVGHCSSLALARADIGACRSFADLLAATRVEIIGALRHQGVSWPTLSAMAWPEPAPSRVPPVSAVLNLAPPLDLDGPLQPKLDLMADAVTASQFEIGMNVLRQADGLRLECFYDADLFDQSTIELLARRFRTILAAVAADPDQPIEDIALLDGAERHRLLVDFNEKRGTARLDQPYAALFARQVERSPDAVAALQADRCWSYAELDARANAIAWRLIELGIERDAVVTILAERRLEFLAAMLGILKVGAAFMPLSPTDPVERVARLLAASGARLALVDARLERRWEAIAKSLRVREPLVLTIEHALAEPTDRGAPPPQRSSASGLAYVMHTSGSTGVPKAAMVEHRGMVNHIFSKIADCGLGAQDVVAQLSHQCFDVMVWQMLAPLLAGGAVSIIGEPQALHPLDTMMAIEATGVTVVEMVPVFIAGTLDVLDAQPDRRSMLSRLRWLIATGEALPPPLCRRWFQHFPAIPMLNAYGPTECSDDVATHVLTQPPDLTETVVPIGRPIQNARIYILDQTMRLLPIGAIGELCVGGAVVGRGYLGDPVRTAEAFPADPFGGGPDDRLYRTGDLARWRGDGTIEFLGRRDRQVKINGVRVEPGEVEAAILRHPAIGQAAVQVMRDGNGGARLIAKLKARNGEQPSNAEVRRFLGTLLPSQLIPSDFQYLDQMPLTQTGKLDRQALMTQPPAAQPQSVQGRMTEIWAEVLGHHDFGEHDSFFELGGKSFDAMELVSRIRTTFPGDIPVQVLLRAPTIAGMTGKIHDLLAGREMTIE